MNRTNETLLDVEGMSCPSCVSHVDRALRDVEGVKGVEVRLREGKVRVQHDAGEARIGPLIEALRAAGYASRVAEAA